MITIRRLLVLILIIICCALIANADDNKGFKCENNTYSSTGREKSNSTAINMSPSSGSCYIIKVSAKINKEYKQYLGPDVSQDICKKLGKEYKSKKKK